MKTVKTCSISGLSFRMDEDAWQTLGDYLASLKKSYADNPDGGEIIADIEARIAELILSTQDNGAVVEQPLVKNIILQLGSVDDIIEESETGDRTPAGEPRIPRRLYRDMANARLGGVCSGIARYFDLDPIVVRLVVLSPLIMIAFSLVPFMHWLADAGFSLACVFSICYLIVWFSVPADRSPRQKLEASGERITVHSISGASAENRDVDSKARPVIAETVTVFGRIVTLLLKIVGAALFFGLILAVVGLVIGLFAVIFAGSDIFADMGVFCCGDMITVEKMVVYAVLAIVACLLPTLLLVYVLACLLLGMRPKRIPLLVLFMLWLAIVVALPVMVVRDNSDHILRHRHHHNMTVECCESHPDSLALSNGGFDADAASDADADDIPSDEGEE